MAMVRVPRSIRKVFVILVKKTLKRSLLLLLTSCCILQLLAQKDTVISKDIVYAQAGEKKLLLDIYKPSAVKLPYLIVWVHGGAWRSGSKANPPLGLLGAGYALASIDFHLSEEAPFPSMVHDIKAAIRYLRANANKYGYRADKIVIWGSSSGGHLAALVGTTNNDKYMEGTLGDYTGTSSAVQGIIDYYGPTNLISILSQSTPHGISVREPAMKILFGKSIEEAKETARLASPVFQTDPSDPPLLIVHGDQDNQVPVNQSLELMAAYKKNKLPVQIEFAPGAGHGDGVYYRKEMLSLVSEFLKKLVINRK
jgi:acetyl esterase/lipase